MPIRVRRAREADLPSVNDVFYEAEMAGISNPPPKRTLPIFAHELATGDMWVAEEAGRVVGYCVVLVRGPVAYLAELFIRPAYQSAQTGQALLERALPAEGVRCTVASRDPRALALYVRHGMQPQWPNIWLVGTSARALTLPASDVEVSEAPRGDADIVRWDAEISGRPRPQEHAYWQTSVNATPLWFRRRGEPVGYGYVRLRSPGSLWNPQATTLGPIGARTPEDARDCVLATLRWAAPHGESLVVALPGPHPALKAVLDARFRLVYVETYCQAYEAPPLFDPQCYAASVDAF